jgi:acetyl-CoA carboxylase biotin carboxyl carrier protein
VSLRFDDIAEILKIIDSSSCDEVVVETGDVRLVVRRNGAAGQPTVLLNDRPLSHAPATSAVQGPATATAAPPQIETAAGQIEVVAPMVGTFYRAPSPDAPAFVEVGTMVKAGQPLCLIEVMKLFTTINSEVGGRIVQIGADNGELVEYGRALFVIEPG